jgi:hypothetical protein
MTRMEPISDLYAPEGRTVVEVGTPDELLPSPHNFLHGRSFLRILLPAFFKELPDLSSEPKFLKVLRHLRPASSRNVKRSGFALHPFEGYLAGEDLHREHPESEYVCSLGLHYQRTRPPANGGYDLGGQPSRGSSVAWGSSEIEFRVGVDRC